jgi:hypothetical protein
MYFSKLIQTIVEKTYNKELTWSVNQYTHYVIYQTKVKRGSLTCTISISTNVFNLKNLYIGHHTEDDICTIPLLNEDFSKIIQAIHTVMIKEHLKPIDEFYEKCLKEEGE